jgi:very-short-patch-repair endonuclease
MRTVDWTIRDEVTASIVLADDNLWFPAKAIASLYNVTVQNVSLHIKDLKQSGFPSGERQVEVLQREGTRMIRRDLTHYSFDMVHAIALRAQRYDELSLLVDFAQREALLKPVYKIAPIKERNFAVLLIGALDGLQTVVPQFPVGPYFIDFYLPNAHVAVEYDEHHHKKEARREHDEKRQRFIEETLNVNFIRVLEGFEVAGLNSILMHVFSDISRA